MSNNNLLRGFKDFIFEDAEKLKYIIDIAAEVAANYSFHETYFPLLEESDTYTRSLGENSDIIGKETYNFIDKGGNNITLRPEFTAGIVRALIQHKLYDKLPLKFFTFGPLFRYERPQKGRARQFHQINFEYFGNASYYAELELLLLVRKLCKKLGIRKKISLEINSLGSSATRAKYKAELVNYLIKYKNSLSENSKIRLEKNPLRILDSKDAKDQEIVADAPKINDFYDIEDQRFFVNIVEYLSHEKLEFRINPKLVRGLDYYSQTVFEFTTNELGAQNAVFAGGRYNDLVSAMGGKFVPAIGFAGGVERLIELIDYKDFSAEKNFVLPVSEAEFKFSFRILDELRDLGYNFEIAPNAKNLTKSLKKIAAFKPHFVFIIGEEELKNNNLIIKNFRSGQEHKVEVSDWSSAFRKIYNNSTLKTIK
jgi:histidyl-tRNA synthetase